MTGLCRSRTFLFNKILLKTGTKVKAKINAPNNAKPIVNANGLNSFPSTFWNEKMGSKAVIMMSLDVKIDLPISTAVFRILLSLARLLKFSIPSFSAQCASITNNPSTITTAPSIIIPKSMAPIESILAVMPLTRIKIKANSKANGMMSATVTVVRQSARKMSKIMVTSVIPKNTFSPTVRMVWLLSSVRS